MAHQIDSARANTILEASFNLAEEDHRNNRIENVPKDIATASEVLFASSTQAFREALVGCALAKLVNAKIDIRYPRNDQGEHSFSGRSLAERVVTPFLTKHAVPVSRSPYLSSLRGNVKFVPDGQPRILRDQDAYDKLVFIVSYLNSGREAEVNQYLRYLLQKFVELREFSNISLRRIARPSLEQLQSLVGSLLTLKSGGRIPAIVAVGIFQALSERFEMNWEVEYQGINTADSPTSAVGDITIKCGSSIVFGVEVTERSITGDRVRVTFDQKVSPNQVFDYIFISTSEPGEDAKSVARSYTRVGNEMNFVLLENWASQVLSVLGAKGRHIFQEKMISLMSSADVPSELKVGWNTRLDEVIGV